MLQLSSTLGRAIQGSCRRAGEAGVVVEPGADLDIGGGNGVAAGEAVVVDVGLLALVGGCEPEVRLEPFERVEDHLRPRAPGFG